MDNQRGRFSRPNLFAHLVGHTGKPTSHSLFPPPTLMGAPRVGRARVKQGGITAIRTGPPEPWREPDHAKKLLGEVSQQYEVGDRGVGAVSTGMMGAGRRDPGGVSYGPWQLATNRGRPQEFLQSEGQISRAAPGTPEFAQAWREVAGETPREFQHAQREFIRRTHYGRALSRLRETTGADLSSGSSTLQNVIWSTAVQHGPDTPVFANAVRRVEGLRGNPHYEYALIDAIYDERRRQFPETADRFRRERLDALAAWSADRDLKVPPVRIPPRLAPRVRK